MFMQPQSLCPADLAPNASWHAGMSRRHLLAAPLLGLYGSAHASAGAWMPYRSDRIKRIAPTLSNGASATRRIEPVISQISGEGMEPVARPPHADMRPPKAYAITGARHGIAPWLLYGVALQESKIKFGERTLPYPWTLCVQGKGMRFASYDATLEALKDFVQRKVTNVDIGAMQVNWRWHAEKLGSFERALDPYPNLAVGARILKDHFAARGHWPTAIALYHTGSDSTQETRRRGARYASQVLQRLARMGVDVNALMRTGIARRVYA